MVGWLQYQVEVEKKNSLWIFGLNNEVVLLLGLSLSEVLLCLLLYLICVCMSEVVHNYHNFANVHFHNWKVFAHWCHKEFVGNSRHNIRLNGFWQLEAEGSILVFF